jgi:NTP pyrophosphatase (non-canonical NTP hydrolase)
MKPLPTPEENPAGLHGRYRITKANGDPVDPSAEYFVLRLDHAADFAHLSACRAALALYANAIEPNLPQLANELRERHMLPDGLKAAWSYFAAGTYRTNVEKGFGIPVGATVDWDGNQIALMHGELSEAHEGIRKDLMDDKLPHRKAVEVELADTIIRIMNYATERDLDVVGAMVEKAAFNKTRPFKHGGKKF